MVSITYEHELQDAAVTERPALIHTSVEGAANSFDFNNVGLALYSASVRISFFVLTSSLPSV